MTDQYGKPGTQEKGDEQHEHDDENSDEGHSSPNGDRRLLSITVNGQPYQIHRGARTGLEIRQAAGCPSTYSLKLLPDLKEVGLTDKVTIKGGEAFSCHEPMGQVS